MVRRCCTLGDLNRTACRRAAAAVSGPQSTAAATGLGGTAFGPKLAAAAAVPGGQRGGGGGTLRRPRAAELRPYLPARSPRPQPRDSAARRFGPRLAAAAVAGLLPAAAAARQLGPRLAAAAAAAGVLPAAAAVKGKGKGGEEPPQA